MSRVNTGAGLVLVWFHVVSVHRNLISMRKSLFSPSMSLSHATLFEVLIIIFDAHFPHLRKSFWLLGKLVLF